MLSLDSLCFIRRTAGAEFLRGLCPFCTWFKKRGGLRYARYIFKNVANSCYIFDYLFIMLYAFMTTFHRQVTCLKTHIRNARSALHQKCPLQHLQHQSQLSESRCSQNKHCTWACTRQANTLSIPSALSPRQSNILPYALDSACSFQGSVE